MGELYKGCEVIVLSLNGASSRYSSDLVGLEGTVEETCDAPSGKRVGIRIPKHTNSMSEKNYFWFPVENLEVKKGNIEMEKNAKVYVLAEVNNINDNTLGVYQDGELKEGDMVVCDYKYKNGKLSVRKVVRLYMDDLHRVDAEILGVADISAYVARKEKAARRVELKKQMIEQAKKYQEEEYWRVISETDPTMMALYEEFKNLEY